MLPSLITLDDLSVWLGVEFTNEQAPRVDAIIAAASIRVRKYAGETWVDENGALDDDIDDAVTTVVKLVAARVWNNPAGAQVESSGPFGVTWGDEAAELLKLTDTEESMITSTLDTPSPGLWVIPTTRGDLETPGRLPTTSNDLVDTIYSATGLPGEPILFGPETFE